MGIIQPGFFDFFLPNPLRNHYRHYQVLEAYMGLKHDEPQVLDKKNLPILFF